MEGGETLAQVSR